jgi:hypothetical protein
MIINQERVTDFIADAEKQQCLFLHFDRFNIDLLRMKEGKVRVQLRFKIGTFGGAYEKTLECYTDLNKVRAFVTCKISVLGLIKENIESGDYTGLNPEDIPKLMEMLGG